MRKGHLAHDALGHHAPGDGHFYRFLIEDIVIRANKTRMQILGPLRSAEAVREEKAITPQLVELAATFRDESVFFLPGVVFLFFGHIKRLL
jgi:hypothetical protein